MVIQDGVQSFDFQQEFELPKPLRFATDGDALNWVKRLCSKNYDLIFRLREYLARYSWDPESNRLTDDQVMERLAVLLYSRRIVVIVRETRTGGGRPTPRAEVAAPPFPLSERKRSTPSNGKWRTWIAIELKDSDDNPVPGENYRLELPGGRVVEGQLDDDGQARVTGIDPGQCRVTFPRLDESTWDFVSSRVD